MPSRVTSSPPRNVAKRVLSGFGLISNLDFRFDEKLHAKDSLIHELKILLNCPTHVTHAFGL